MSSRQALEITKKGALNSQVIKFTSCLPMVGGSLQLLPPLKLVAMILLKVVLNTKNQLENQFLMIQLQLVKETLPRFQSIQHSIDWVWSFWKIKKIVNY